MTEHGLITIDGKEIEAEKGANLLVAAFDDEIEEYRRTTLELHLAEHDYECPVCDANGECELQDVAYRYDIGVEKNRSIPSLPMGNQEGSIRLPHDKTSPVLEYEAAKCIRCGRCIQACDEIQEKGVLGFVHRGYHTFVSAEFGAWKNSTCDGCRVRVITRRGDIEIFARKSDRVAAGTVFIPFHFHESPANRLTNDVLDPVAKIPELKVAVCRIEKME